MNLPCRYFLKIGGVSGAAAVLLGAYAAHGFNGEKMEKRKHSFETGARLHMIHSVALLAVPLANRPKLVGSLMTSGIIFFSGACYAYGITGDPKFAKIAPLGGLTLALAWLVFVL